MENKSFDLGILSVFDTNPIDKDNIKAQVEKNVIQLYHKLFEIKQRQTLENDLKKDELQEHDFEKSIYEINLPEMETVLPRQKTLPKQKELTRWEKFAKEKGIKKKKKSYLAYDEELGEYAPRWGPYSAKKQKEKLDIIREVKQGEDPYEDPWKKDKLKKNLLKEQQKLSEIKNRLNAKGYNGRQVLNSQSEAVGRRKQKTNEIKQKTKKSLSIAQQSTRSMGNFDKKAHQEEKQLKTKKRKVLPSFKNTAEEKSRDMDMLNFILNNKGNKKTQV
ncbi:hypothetical protein PPERSA_10229 [Pseudocohnilembus persalinus]|uniref:Ribosome biogenesis regulatory protein n=1 Tax=Pseudocohnilembus persalinus TaxID=266149 RepID=A0A0V0QLY8_PSEPJ|nr:hypothetical protein PPERSA_10229 [Pseudocohnilembus persalinus]|eukprot:KRX03148.1 hypothetical protein PPERSA_10229 [Pseudocohnilembus persalinus]